jgi:5-amino-6-(5-phospho-D-ribitylamino)uracil phosphatase
MLYRLLAIDIDGTLVNSRDELTPATRDALMLAGRSGIRVALATGRRYSKSLHLVEPLGIDVPLVSASGALIKDPLDHRTLFRARFERDALADTLKIIDDFGFDALVCSDTFLQGYDFYLARFDVSSPQLAEYLMHNAADGRLWPRMTSEPPQDAFMAFTMGTRQQMLDLESLLHARVPGKLHTHVLRSPKYAGFMCEIAPAGVTKWSGILHVAAQWGIEESAICAVGDDVNDIPMIRAAGLGVAMGNALPPVKEAADRIAPTHDEDGLVQVVEWLLTAR